MTITLILSISFLVFAIARAVTRNFQLDYNAEYHIGLIAGDFSPETKAANSALLTAALAASHARGLFNFYRGPVTSGNVDRFIKFPPKTFYFSATVVVPPKIGGALIGAGGSSYEKGDYDYEDHTGTTGGLRTRLVFDDPNPPQSIAFISGTTDGFSVGPSLTSSPVSSIGATLAVVSVSCLSGFAPYPSDSEGNEYAQLTSYQSIASNIILYYCIKPKTSAAHTVTITGGLPTIGVMFFSGVGSIQTSIGNATETGTTGQPGSITSKEDGALYVVASSDFSSVHTLSPGVAVTASGSQFIPIVFGLHQGGGLGYFIQTTKGAASPTLTTDNVNRCVISAVFLPTGTPFFRYQGTGFEARSIDFYGARTAVENTPIGTKALALIQIEGRAQPATGRHIFKNCGFFQAKYGIQTIPGYYDSDGSFIGDENHADQSLVDNCEFSTVDSCFRSECLQASGWNFRKIIVGQLGTPTDMIVFDIERGGSLTANHVLMNHPKITLFRTSHFNQNISRLNAHDVFWDRFIDLQANIYCTLFKYDGADFSDNSSLQWSVRVDGAFTGFASDTNYFDASKLVIVPGHNFPINDLLFDIKSLPTSASFVTAPSPYKVYSP